MVQRNRLVTLFGIAKETGYPSDQENFTAAKRMYRKNIKDEKIIANEKWINNSKNKCAAAWSIINKEIGKNDIKDNITVSPNEFNEYFVNITNKSDNNKIIRDNTGKILDFDNLLKLQNIS